MARPLRIEFPGAIYHVMSRGNARQTVFRDDSDYQRLIKGLETVVGRLGWDLLCFVLMPNHFHLLVRTPRPNLSQGMQHLTSGYANWCSRRHRRPGHTFQGRFKSELIEDESYFWTVSRYIHLNPVRGERPLADHPRDWPWSSYPGYDRRRRRVGWVAYEALHSAWRGESGGNDPEAAYRRFVEQGLARAPANPFQSAAHGWLLGSETFIERMRSLLSEPRNQDEVPAARQLASLDAAIVLAEVARYYGVGAEGATQSLDPGNVDRPKVPAMAGAGAVRNSTTCNPVEESARPVMTCLASEAGQSPDGRGHGALSCATGVTPLELSRGQSRFLGDPFHCA